MTFDHNYTCNIVCTCNHYMPPFEVWKEPGYNRDLALFATRRGTSVPKIYEWMLDELFVYRSGQVFDHRRERIDLMTWDAAGDDYIDRNLGKDAYRTLRRYLDRIHVNRVNRLYKEHTGLATLLTHFRAVHLCRTSGPCSIRAQKNRGTQ